MKNWKPTQEQMNALKRAVELGESGDRSMFSANEAENLKELYDILNQIRNEKSQDV